MRGTASPLSVKPLSGVLAAFFCQVTLSDKNGAKLESNDEEYCKFCRQALNVVIDSCLVSDHCLGARLVFMVIHVGTLVRIKGKEFVLSWWIG